MTNALPLRYVVLHHTGVPEPHYDLMFETAPGSPLATWRSPAWPPGAGDVLSRLPDHRQAYLDFEGPISDARGAVRRVASGRCEMIQIAEAKFVALLDTGVEVVLTRDDADRWFYRVER